ncbi:Late competence protein ComEC, DNA transport [Alkalibacterium sp. AK22]|nr:Late competence protein ComEC, DNA transport [Alkalibacterium sp. AK22]
MVYLIIVGIGLLRLVLTGAYSLAAAVVVLLLLLFTVDAASTSDYKNTDTTYHLIEVKQTSWTVDGNQLKFHGRLWEEEEYVQLAVSYRFDTEAEKAASLTPPLHLIAKGQLTFPEGPRNINQFDYPAYLSRKNIVWILRADQLNFLKDTSLPQSLLYRLDSKRQQLLSYCDQAFKPVTARYVKALLFADRRELSKDVTASFRQLGLLHLLSISGLHISLFLAVAELGMKKLRITVESSGLVLLLLLPVILAAAGMGVSVMRAVTQAWTKYLSDVCKWELTAGDCWSAALMLTLLLNSSAFYFVGFQLSFSLSLLILLISAQTFYQQATHLVRFITLNILLFIASIPVLSYHFYEFSWGVLLLNSLYIPILSFIIMPGLLFFFFISPLLFYSNVFMTAEHLFAELLILMERLTLFIDSSVSLMYVSGRLLPVVTLLWISLMISGLVYLEKKGYGRLLLVFLAGFWILLQVNRYSPLGRIVMIDVGQGDAVLIKEPFNRGNHLIDTGGIMIWQTEEDWQERADPFTLGGNVLVPVIKSMGVPELDHVIITHPHWDHYGALKELTEGIKVKKVLTNHYTLKHPDFIKMLTGLKDQSIKIESTDEAGNGLVPAPAGMKVLTDDLPASAGSNDRSLVLAGSFGRNRWLFTGDIESDREDALMRLYPDLRADVLKVAHHGSHTSSKDSFIRQVQPTYSLISVGANNRYAHPQQEVLERLNHYGSVIYRTDNQGGVIYTYADHPLFDWWIRQREPFQTIIQ